MKLFKEHALIRLFFLILFTCYFSSVWASVGISVNPLDGSNGLRFERVLPGLKNAKQVRVRISSTGGERFQVFQRVFGPISNEKGQPLELGAVETGTMSGSNTSGSLYMQNADHLSYSEQLLYSSGQEGLSDSFIIAYAPRPELLKNSGNYAGKIVFTVRPSGGSAQSESSIDLFLESVSNWKTSIAGGITPNQIRISDTNTAQRKADYVNVMFSGNGGNDVRITQEFESYPQNDAGQELPSGALEMSVDSDTQGLRVHGVTEVPRARQLIYSSNQTEDRFAINFIADPQKLRLAEAGVYRGRLKYTVETDADRQEFTMDFECRVEPAFTMDVTIPHEGLGFGKIIPTTPPVEKEITVTVRTNLHKPYQVLQNLQSPMVNEQGKEFGPKYFMFKVDVSNDQKGQTRFPELVEVQMGEYPVFSSDASGSPVTFKIIYQLRGYPGMNAGSFLAPLKFSLNQN